MASTPTDAAQVVERPADVQVGNIDVLVLMGRQRLRQARAFLFARIPTEAPGAHGRSARCRLPVNLDCPPLGDSQRARRVAPGLKDFPDADLETRHLWASHIVNAFTSAPEVHDTIRGWDIFLRPDGSVDFGTTTPLAVEGGDHGARARRDLHEPVLGDPVVGLEQAAREQCALVKHDGMYVAAGHGLGPDQGARPRTHGVGRLRQFASRSEGVCHRQSVWAGGYADARDREFDPFGAGARWHDH